METVGIVIIMVTLTVGAGVIAIILLPTDDEMRTKAFQHELGQILATRPARTGSQPVAVAKAEAITTLAVAGTQKIVAQGRLQACLRRTDAAFETHRALIRLHKTAVDKMATLNLAQAEKSQRLAEIEQAIKKALSEF